MDGMRAQSLELHMEFDLSKYQTEMTPKTVWHFSGITQKIPQFENHRKSLIQCCERANRVTLTFSVDKSSSEMQKMVYFGEFLKTEVSGQTVLPDR